MKNREPGAYGMQRVMHDRRRAVPPRRDLTLRKAVEMAGLGVIGYEVEVIPTVWVRVHARYRGTAYAIDPRPKNFSRMGKVRWERKVQALKDAGIPHVVVRVTAPDETAHAVLKGILRARRVSYGRE